METTAYRKARAAFNKMRTGKARASHTKGVTANRASGITDKTGHASFNMTKGRGNRKVGKPTIKTSLSAPTGHQASHLTKGRQNPNRTNRKAGSTATRSTRMRRKSTLGSTRGQ